jgi:hypothetical protein
MSTIPRPQVSSFQLTGKNPVIPLIQDKVIHDSKNRNKTTIKVDLKATPEKFLEYFNNGPTASK